MVRWIMAMGAACAAMVAAASARGAEGDVVKAVLDVQPAGESLLRADGWHGWQDGFVRQGEEFVCDNGANARAQRGASQSVVLNQSEPQPLLAVAWSRAENVAGPGGGDYAIYLDLVYTDGTPDWGKTAPFNLGSHDWQRRQIVILPKKPIRSLSFHLLLRSHTGKAAFRGAELRPLLGSEGACLFDSVPVVEKQAPAEGFLVRDVAAGSPFVRIEREALGLRLDVRPSQSGEVRYFDVELTDTTGRDRAVTLVYAVPVKADGLHWLDDPRRSEPVAPRREYLRAGHFRAGASGALSRYPLAAVATPKQGTALGIDMTRPAYFRLAYSSGTGELYLAYDIGLAPEKPSARVRFCRYGFDPAWGFRAALARYYQAYPDAFVCRTPRQGLWMPFAAISKVKGWEDFGFAFKEGNDETAWDDAHGIVTFRYTEPMTWWMAMPADMPRTPEAALAHARALVERGNREAEALLTSGYHDAAGEIPARLLDTPWCNGAVWSINSMPGIAGEVTDFRNKWNPALREKLYGPESASQLDGEYIDSSEGYVTDELDFRRDHFAAADTPLAFSLDERRPAIFRGLIAFEYARGLARDVHAMDRLMMANGAPGQLCWLVPWLDVMGTETDWNPGGTWRPMSDEELLYRRSLCRGRPYCFLMNTEFERFSHELVEKYMKRSLAYGMFPGFFSHNASQGHYFTRPELYDRDRPLFRKYVPLCRRVAEAGWEPVTLARSDAPQVYVERFGRRYLTVFNDSREPHTVHLRIADPALLPAGSPASRNLVDGAEVTWRDGETSLTLGAEDVAVIDLAPGEGQ